MANDFIREGDQVSGADITISKAPSQGTSFLSSFLGGLTSGSGSEARMKKEKDKLEYYTQLREAGYSSEEATARVNKQFSGSFLDRALGRNSAGFQGPDPASDTFTSKSAKDKAAAAKDTAMASYYNRSQGKTNSPKNETGNAQRMVSLENMIAGLESKMKKVDSKKNPDQFKKLETRLGLYQKQLEKLTGVSQEDGDGGGEEGPYVPGETQVGQKFKHTDGKTYIVRNADDPNDPEVVEA